MERILINELKLNIGKTVFIEGWVHKIRKLGKIAFIILRDRSGVVQCVIDAKKIDIKNIKLESVISIYGTINVNKNSTGSVEVFAERLNVISSVHDDMPIEVNKDELEANIDTILNNRVLSLRHPKINAIFKIQACLVEGFSEFLRNEGFIQVFTPKIVAEGTEGGTELFEIKYFEKKAYLAQSPQFYKQMLVGAGYERVFEIGHVYRAEEHNTLRHLNEYVSMDLEMGFIKDENDIMDMETTLLKYMFKNVQDNCSNEIKLYDINVPKLENIPSMKLSEAISVLKKEYGKNNLTTDLDPEGEKLICEYVEKKYGSEFIFLTHYPRSKRPMYTMPAEDDLTHSFDLLFRGLEITTGGQRIHSYEQLKESIRSKGFSPDKFEGYLKVFKYGMPPHGGLAIGLERLTAQLMGYKNVRETCLFPRDRNRIVP